MLKVKMSKESPEILSNICKVLKEPSLVVILEPHNNHESCKNKHLFVIKIWHVYSTRLVNLD